MTKVSYLFKQKFLFMLLIMLALFTACSSSSNNGGDSGGGINVSSTQLMFLQQHCMKA